jgi:hypothetical protein
MIGRWLREGRLWAVAAMVIVAALLPTTTVAASTFIYDAPADTRVDICAFDASAVGLSQLSDAQEASASPSVEVRGPSTTPSAPVVATNTADDFANWDGEFADDAIRAPATRPDFANISAKIERQMQTRGWTPDLIDEAVTSGNKFPAVNKLGGANTPERAT